MNVMVIFNLLKNNHILLVMQHMLVAKKGLNWYSMALCLWWKCLKCNLFLNQPSITHIKHLTYSDLLYQVMLQITIFQQTFIW